MNCQLARALALAVLCSLIACPGCRTPSCEPCNCCPQCDPPECKDGKCCPDCDCPAIKP